MNRPLKRKTTQRIDYANCKWVQAEHVKSAVEWLKEQIIITGGLAVSELIDKAFEDVTFNSIKETEVKKRLQLC